MSSTSIQPARIPPSPASPGVVSCGPRRKKLKWSRRDAESSHLYNLRLDLNALRQEIQQLQELRQIVQVQTLNTRSVQDAFYVKTGIECNRVLKAGYSPQEDSNCGEAEQFITRTLDENVSVGRFSGHSIVLDQWARFTKAFTGLQYQMLSSRVVVSTDEIAMVTVTTNIQHAVTRDTLAIMFPCVLQAHPHLVTRLLGRQLRFLNETTFTFDRSSHQVISINTQMDSLEAFGRMLQNPVELDAFFRGSKITEEFFIGDVDHYSLRTEGQHSVAASVVSKSAAIPLDSPPDKMQLQHILAE